MTVNQRRPPDQPFILEAEPPIAEPLSAREPGIVIETDDRRPIAPEFPSVQQQLTAEAIPMTGSRPFGMRWLAPASVVGGLVGLVGVWALLWVQGLMADHPWFGTVAALFLLILLGGVLGLAAGELRALSRLTHGQAFRDMFAAQSDAAPLGRERTAQQLRRLGQSLHRMPAMSSDVARWEAAFRPEHPARDMVDLFEATVMAPADQAALAASRRSVRIAFGLVALSPTALSDTVLFWYRALRLVRTIAEIYGYRPSRTTTLLLANRALRDAGLLAGVDLAGDAIGHFLGGKMLERVSAAAAEGAVAGYRMARFALLVIDACRPMPFGHGRRPQLLDLLPPLGGGGARR